MTNKLLINGIDVANYGMVPLKGYLIDVLTMPKTNEVTFLDWYEGNTDADLVDGVTFAKEREITIPFYCKNINQNYNNFIDLLLSNPYNNFTFVDINMTLSLRLKSEDKNNVWGFNNKNTFDLKFIQDNYSIALIDNHVIQPISISDFITIDNINIGEYGFRITNGTLNNILSIKDTFERLKNSSNAIKSTSTDIEIKLCCTKLDIVTFIKNYYSLIYFLTTPNSKSLKYNYNQTTYQFLFFFKEIKIDELVIDNNKVFVMMTLVIKSLSKFAKIIAN